MKSETKILSVILIFSAILLIGAVTLLSMGQKNTVITPETEVTIDYSTGEKIGSDSAKVKIVEYSDFQCPACKAFEPALQKVLNDYKEDIQFVYKYFPLPLHFNSKPASNFAIYSATEGKFWETHGKLFQTQEEWALLKNPNEYFLKLGKDLGLDETKLKIALDNNSFYPEMEKTMAEGEKIGVNSTPTVFVNNKKLNLSSYEDLETKVKQILGK